MVPLLTFLAKQTGLQTLEMHNNYLSYAQKNKIHQTVSDSASGCAIEIV